MYTFLSHTGGQIMINYLLTRNNTFYYRRRIPKEYSYLFSQKNEIRIKMVKKSYRTAILDSNKTNLLFEEMLNMLRLDTFDKKEQIVQEYMDMMKKVVLKSIIFQG